MIGKTLVHYEITAQIGKGGMGEVYQAKDTKLGREVAIKVLPEEFALDKDRLARFQREAKLLASLNHPNIAAIHGLEESEGIHFLVMELIEGDTLRDRIKSGPIPVEEALKLALQMAEALEAAHEKGVIHRDLKPANIKVTTDGKVKILDFGLAKAYAGDQENISPMDSPTISAAATQQGVILGTAAYMSPEQARGKPVDKRADIWAFGVVLYEMLTGKTAFQGEDVSETLASVIKGDSNLSLLPANIHPRIREVITRCLQKDMRKRYSSMGDARYEIEQALSDPSGVFVQPSIITKPKKKLQLGIPLVAAITILGIIIAGVAIWYLKPAPPPEPKRVMRFSYELPEDQQFNSGIMLDILLAVSPDSSQFVYCTTNGLYLRSVDALDARFITGTDRNSRQPVFSPDGKWVGYWSLNDQKLKKIAISGGVPVVLCDTSTILGGLSWSSDNTIMYSDVYGGGVKRVSAEGGTPESIIEAELVNMGTDGIPILPQMLPDGKSVLFTNAFSNNNTADRQITVQSLESGERKVLVGGTGAQYLSSGHLVYVQENNNIRSLLAVPFDLETMEVKGGPVPLLESIGARAISDSGTLVYVPIPMGMVENSVSPKLSLVWVYRDGKEEPLLAPPHDYRQCKISPDGTRVALSVVIDGNQDIRIWDIVRNNLMRLTFDEARDRFPLWTPDSQRVVFASDREGGIFWKKADGTGGVELLGSASDRAITPWSLSGDGSILALGEYRYDPLGKYDVGMLSMEGDRERTPLLQEEYEEQEPQISPDGRWIAYASNESGRQEIYVRSFPEVESGGRWQVSNNGGISPLWSRDGKELFYRSGDATMVVQVETDPIFKPENPKVLFSGRYYTLPDIPGLLLEQTPWDIHPDGTRFLMMKEPGTTGDESTDAELASAGPRKINIVLNWDVELKQRVPVD
jgi:serine/threonine protein kinase